MPIAYMPNLNAITLLQMDGMLTTEEFEQALNLGVEGCKQISEIQKEALRAKYVTVKEAPAEKDEEADKEANE